MRVLETAVAAGELAPLDDFLHAAMPVAIDHPWIATEC